jgi:ATP-dependent Clp protease protease subunit
MPCPEEQSNDTARNDAMTARLLKTRTVLIMGAIDQELAERVMTQLLVLDADSNEPIRVFITSPGGHVDSGFAIHDMLRFVKSPVIAIGAGWLASMAVPIMLAAKKENRFALPNTRFMMHQPSGGAGGQAADIRIEAQEIIKIRNRINELISEGTGQTHEKVADDSDRNFWLNAEEALEYGLISKIVNSMDDI